MSGNLNNLNALPQNTPLFNANYTIQRPIGTGGFSITYLATDQTLQREVAIKEFFPEGSTRDGVEVHPPSNFDPGAFLEAKRSFMAEARHLARFRHPNIVTAHSFFEENATAYLVMEYLQGRTLREVVESDGPLAENRATEIIKYVGAALQAVHENQTEKLLHRDVNPNNIMLCHDGRVVLMDFGLTQVIEETTSYQTRILRANNVFFTPGFAAPEQYKKDATLTAATDVYGLASTLYFLLTGKVPMDAQARWMGDFDTLPEQRAFQPAVNATLNTAVKEAMAQRAEDRPRSVQTFLDRAFGGSVASTPRATAQPSTPQARPKSPPASGPGTPFKFQQGSAASLTDLIELCDQFPHEARQYFEDGTLANWVSKSLGEHLLAGHIQGARQDCIRNLGTNPKSSRAFDEEIRKGTELMMRHLYRTVGLPSLPQIAARPSELNLGEVISGHEKRAKLDLWNQGRGDAWGTVQVNPPSPLISIPRTFSTLSHAMELVLDTTKGTPEDYRGELLIRGEGLLKVCKVPLKFQVIPLELTITPPQVDFGKVRAGTTAEAEVHISWLPADTKLVGAVYRVTGDVLENRQHYCDLMGDTNSFTIRISPPLSATRLRPYREIFRLVTNAGEFDIPVNYRVLLTGFVI